ncbi:MAG: diphthine synthase [Euryarchaeota archaeon]|nr:diphthine synthase [Euryarchaeota archaeon]
MGILYLIGLGLCNEKDLTLRGLEILRNKVKEVYIELYTAVPRKLNVDSLKELIGKDVKVLGRDAVESNYLLDRAKKTDVALIVPGDPLIATTHISLILEARKRGIAYRVVHNASVLTAVPGACGLHAYKFGRTTTLPYPYKGHIFESPYDVIKENLSRGLHTLILLDLDPQKGSSMSVREGIEMLMKIEERRKEGVIRDDSILVGLSNIGSDDEIVKAGYPKDLMRYKFPMGMHSIVVVGNLHFTEAEALVYLADAPKEILKNV